MKLTVIDGGASEAPPPADNGMAERLKAMVEECLKGKPTVVMLVWESGTPGSHTELMTLVTPPSQAVIRGLVELLHEQIHSSEI